MDNPVGYLYRVGQSASRACTRPRPIPFERHQPIAGEVLVIGPELSAAINRLPVQQRTVVMLVHAFGWTQRDVAELLDISRSTVREHLDRAVTRLNHDLEVRGVR